MTDKNPAYYQAANDFDERTVAVEHGNIAKLERPKFLGANLAPVTDERLTGLPLLFTSYIIVMNSLNFQFWEVDGQGQFIRYQHDGRIGAIAMQHGFALAWADTMVAHDFERESVMRTAQAMRDKLSPQWLAKYFGDIPQAQARLEILHEVLNPTILWRMANHLTLGARDIGCLDWVDAQLLANVYPKAYGDQYLKKAQLTLMFLAHQWNRMSGMKAVDAQTSAAADYQLPKVLRALGLLTYSEELAFKVDNGILIEEGSDEERAIRAATIHACDAIAAHFACTVSDVDEWIWTQRNKCGDAKFHLTRTTNY